MSEVFLSRSEFADRIGVSSGSISRYRLPEPDVIIGSGPKAPRGWRLETVDRWNASRPGRGRKWKANPLPLSNNKEI